MFDTVPAAVSGGNTNHFRAFEQCRDALGAHHLREALHRAGVFLRGVRQAQRARGETWCPPDVIMRRRRMVSNGYAMNSANTVTA